MEHGLVDVSLIDGLWQWECSCGLTEPGWWRRSNAVKAQQGHAEVEAQYRRTA